MPAHRLSRRFPVLYISHNHLQQYHKYPVGHTEYKCYLNHSLVLYSKLIGHRSLKSIIMRLYKYYRNILNPPKIEIIYLYKIYRVYLKFGYHHLNYSSKLNFDLN